MDDEAMITMILVGWVALSVVFTLGLCRAAAVGDRR
jgi:hypothetical protein